MLTTDQLKAIDAAHLKIQKTMNKQMLQRTTPVPYDAWNAPKDSIMYRMRGAKGCTR
jgi:hypothetical protein